jgi:hypothetical protein
MTPLAPTDTDLADAIAKAWVWYANAAPDRIKTLAVDHGLWSGEHPYERRPFAELAVNAQIVRAYVNA